MTAVLDLFAADIKEAFLFWRCWEHCGPRRTNSSSGSRCPEPPCRPERPNKNLNSYNFSTIIKAGLANDSGDGCTIMVFWQSFQTENRHRAMMTENTLLLIHLSPLQSL